MARASNRSEPGASAGNDAAVITREVAERIRSDHILMRDEARLVRKLAKMEGNRELHAHTASLERLVKTHVSLVEGVLDAVIPEEF
jgi:hypothetical protein